MPGEMRPHRIEAGPSHPSTERRTVDVFTLSDRRTCNRVVAAGQSALGLKVCREPAVVMVPGDPPRFRCLQHSADFEPAEIVGVFPLDTGVMTKAEPEPPAIMFRDLEAELDLLEERVQTIRDRGTVFDSVVADLRAINSQLSQVLQALR